MKLIKIDENHFANMIAINKSKNGDAINEGLSKLFKCMNDESNRFEVSIKVAALNQLYSTAIQYIPPVVEKIVTSIPKKSNYEEQDFVKLIDSISTITWDSDRKGKEYSRNNLSFASKYVHFLSERKTPIYDSHIWIVMIGYLIQERNNKYSFAPPKNYESFYKFFKEFKEFFNLQEKSNYEIDKFLWQYGKNMITEIINEQNVSMDKAKSILKKRITEF
ncbi:MAG: hypothetical protein WAX77_09040 [Methylococcaceae bacterium]